MHDSLRLALHHDAILSIRQHRHLQRRIQHAHASDEVARLLPGTYAPEASFSTLVPAVADWDPSAVFTGSTAARLSWWPECDDDVVRAAVSKQPPPGPTASTSAEPGCTPICGQRRRSADSRRLPPVPWTWHACSDRLRSTRF